MLWKKKPPIELEAQELQELKEAKALLENPSLAAKITHFLGNPIEKGLEKLPENWNTKLAKITTDSLLKAANVAVFTLGEEGGEKTKFSELYHKVAVATTGGVGGFFGLPGLLVELPVSTTIMLRSIAEIARAEGESIQEIETKLACLEVFALGGTSKEDDGVETGYYALAKSITEAAKFITEKGMVDEGAPIVLKLLTKIAEKFGVQVTEKAAGQAIPLLGAAAGGVINTLFMDHFQEMAKGHFVVRRLERKYGVKEIQSVFEKL